MNNAERIRKGNLLVLDFLRGRRNPCKYCAYNNKGFNCEGKDCSEGRRLYLLSEVTND